MKLVYRLKFSGKMIIHLSWRYRLWNQESERCSTLTAVLSLTLEEKSSFLHAWGKCWIILSVHYHTVSLWTSTSISIFVWYTQKAIPRMEYRCSFMEGRDAPNAPTRRCQKLRRLCFKGRSTLTRHNKMHFDKQRLNYLICDKRFSEGARKLEIFFCHFRWQNALWIAKSRLF